MYRYNDYKYLITLQIYAAVTSSIPLGTQETLHIQSAMRGSIHRCL